MLARVAPKLRLRRRGELEEEGEQGVREPEVAIRLTSTSARIYNQVRYDFTTGVYKRVWGDDLLVDLLTLPSRIIHRELQQQQQHPKTDEGMDEATRMMEEVYQDMVSKEELAKLDSQPNPFNFSERVSQTTRFNLRELAIQTEPPPSTAFSVTVGPAEVYDAYQKNYQMILEHEREREREKERERERERERDRERGSGRGKKAPPVASDPLVVAVAPLKKYGSGHLDLPGLCQTARVLERMVNQNIYDDILQDFRYWEDGSDEFRPLEGSLLPLWKFNHDKSRSLVVSDICWSPVYPDLFAAAYTTGEVGGPEGSGMLCLYTLKNPATPERVFHSPCGVTCVSFHPKHGSMVAAGWNDGTVVMYDVRSPTSPIIFSSTTMAGKHLLPVTKVHWVNTDPGEDLCVYSIAMDGRLTQWHICTSALIHTDILHFLSDDLPTQAASLADKILLEGIGTCVAFRPDNEDILLVGVDTGAVFQCSIQSTVHALTRYPAHTAAVRDIMWNAHHHRVFISCSVDWTVKVWFQFHLSPLIVLDLGSAVAGVTWSPYSSSVFVAVTDEGRVHVYDLFMRKCRPLCVQSLVQRRRVAAACVAFNPFYPIILVGGERGNLLSLKLSPNLRKVHKDAKGAEDHTLREIELCKMERLIATNRG
ncbi:dynein intermediate chain 2, ciliary-like isoform X2 [Panulirus ornatus]|uniref:dynein intermediate chain 2, ciliary-like isoform X2 n=1 Tax=Panulirus ornatus TaxID=150431 RepID=UPI003A857762